MPMGFDCLAGSEGRGPLTCNLLEAKSCSKRIHRLAHFCDIADIIEARYGFWWLQTLYLRVEYSDHRILSQYSSREYLP